MTYQPLTIRANVIFLKRADGSGNFDLNDLEQKQLLSDYFKFVNTKYSEIIQPPSLEGCYTGTDFFNDTKIRIEYNYVEVTNTYAWNYLNSGSDPENKKYNGFSPTENWYIKSLDDSIFSAKDIPKGINVYLTTNGERFDKLYKTKSEKFDLTGAAASQYPSSTNLNRSSQVNLPNRFLKYFLHKYQAPIEYNTTWEETYWWHVSDAGGLAHEFGHSFGLGHSNEYHKTNKCKPSIMNQQGNVKKRYLQPTEIKKMHWNLTRTNLMQFVTPESYYGASIAITENTKWNKPLRFYSSFNLEKNIILTISDSIILPPQASIQLAKKSKIVFTGNGKIVDAFGNTFKNYIKHRKAEIITD